MAVAIDDAERALEARLGTSALEHSRRVSETARSLAQTYGVDPEAAALAGLLHDWDRELDDVALMARAQELGIDVTDAECIVPYLLHARTAAADLRVAMPGLSDEVLRAVERHTMGAPHMSDLERVVFIADTIEPARKHRGVKKLRAQVGEASLRELFVSTYAQGLRSLADRRRPIHPSTVETWNAILEESSDD